jgi:hypothetical protein
VQHCIPNQGLCKVLVYSRIDYKKISTKLVIVFLSIILTFQTHMKMSEHKTRCCKQVQRLPHGPLFMGHAWNILIPLRLALSTPYSADPPAPALSIHFEDLDQVYLSLISHSLEESLAYKRLSKLQLSGEKKNQSNFKSVSLTPSQRTSSHVGVFMPSWI